ncbi:hypothetical protein R1flu_025275 [Riccia fluitans]|uniref:Uncharacterized protein n=1 Tax=Riccia fluitans TaxID=41844 RepID=A0ABD1XXA6_9MARC
MAKVNVSWGASLYWVVEEDTEMCDIPFRFLVKLEIKAETWTIAEPKFLTTILLKGRIFRTALSTILVSERLPALRSGTAILLSTLIP